MAPPTEDPDEVLASIDPAPARRGLATGGVGVLGLILVYLAASHPPENPGWLLFMLALGVGSVFLSWRVWTVTGVSLDLTRSALQEAGGRVLFTLDEVKSVDRGFFAFKPASGFLVRLKEPSPRGRVYAPGLWWRAGRTVMVGGVTSGPQGKTVADLISVLLIQRDQGIDRG